MKVPVIMVANMSDALCAACNGKGEIDTAEFGKLAGHMTLCSICRGTGRVSTKRTDRFDSAQEEPPIREVKGPWAKSLEMEAAIDAAVRAVDKAVDEVNLNPAIRKSVDALKDIFALFETTGASEKEAAAALKAVERYFEYEDAAKAGDLPGMRKALIGCSCSACKLSVALFDAAFPEVVQAARKDAQATQRKNLEKITEPKKEIISDKTPAPAAERTAHDNEINFGTGAEMVLPKNIAERMKAESQRIYGQPYTSAVDEISAIEAAWKALERLDANARSRVLTYLTDRLMPRNVVINNLGGGFHSGGFVRGKQS